MKTKNFEIPADSLADFADLLSQLKLDNEIKGKNEEEEVIINVFYKPSEREKILDLIEWVEENVVYDQDEEDDDDEEQDEEEDDE